MIVNKLNKFCKMIVNDLRHLSATDDIKNKWLDSKSTKLD